MSPPRARPRSHRDQPLGSERRRGAAWAGRFVPSARLSPLLLLLPLLSSAACAPRGDAPDRARTISLRDFSRPEALVGPVIEVPSEVFAPPEVLEEQELIAAGDAVIIETREVIRVDAPGGTTRPMTVATTRELAEPMPPGRRWPVESLVGQINGRPIFAGEFFEPIEDRLLRIAAMDNRAEARRGIIDLVRARFEEFIDSELVIAEAESGLSPEQKQGLFAWLMNLREEEIARRGGSLAAAEESVLEEQGLSLEEFMNRRRDIALASDLLRRKIEPRVIVSWREIEAEYRRRESEFNPPASIRIGRIRLVDRGETSEVIARVRAAFAAGAPFAEVARSIGLADDGFWREFTIGPDGVAGLDLAPEFRDSLEGVPTGAAGTEIVRGNATTWLGILAIDEPTGQSLFEPRVQLGLQEMLRSRRFQVEQNRYLQSLRRRWVSEDIGKMRERLTTIALDRYFR